MDRALRWMHLFDPPKALGNCRPGSKDLPPAGGRTIKSRSPCTWKERELMTTLRHCNCATKRAQSLNVGVTSHFLEAQIHIHIHRLCVNK